jgi:hypothetical protein
VRTDFCEAVFNTSQSAPAGMRFLWLVQGCFWCELLENTVILGVIGNLLREP